MSSGELPKALSGGERHEEAELDLPAHTKKDLAAVDSALSTSIHLWLRRRRKNVVGILCAVVHRKRGEKRKGKWLHCCTCLQGSEEADEQPLSVELTHCNGSFFFCPCAKCMNVRPKLSADQQHQLKECFELMQDCQLPANGINNADSTKAQHQNTCLLQTRFAAFSCDVQDQDGSGAIDADELGAAFKLLGKEHHSFLLPV
eukprot:1157760-Pelagomonas_calceolata.AAC.6